MWCTREKRAEWKTARARLCGLSGREELEEGRIWKPICGSAHLFDLRASQKFSIFIAGPRVDVADRDRPQFFFRKLPATKIVEPPLTPPGALSPSSASSVIVRRAWSAAASAPASSESLFPLPCSWALVGTVARRRRRRCPGDSRYCCSPDLPSRYRPHVFLPQIFRAEACAVQRARSLAFPDVSESRCSTSSFPARLT